jgi:hypothetical protein
MSYANPLETGKEQAIPYKKETGWCKSTLQMEESLD